MNYEEKQILDNTYGKLYIHPKNNKSKVAMIYNKPIMKVFVGDRIRIPILLLGYKTTISPAIEVKYNLN